jgi:hypothetical protein
MSDAFIHDERNAYLDAGNDPDEKHEAIWKGLEVKMKHHARLTREAAGG